MLLPTRFQQAASSATGDGQPATHPSSVPPVTEAERTLAVHRPRRPTASVTQRLERVDAETYSVEPSHIALGTAAYQK